MKRINILSVTLILAVAVGTALAGGEGEGKTIEGTLVDTKCYLMNPENTVNDHVTPKGTMPNCGTACAKMGIPVGVLTAGGKLHIVAMPALVLADHVGQTVRATGMLKHGAIVANKMEVKKGNNWEEIKIATMM